MPLEHIRQRDLSVWLKLKSIWHKAKSGAHSSIWIALTIESIWVLRVILPQRGTVCYYQECPKEDMGAGLLWKSVSGRSYHWVRPKLYKNKFYLAYLHVLLGGWKEKSLPLSWLCDRNNKRSLFHFPKSAFSASSSEELQHFSVTWSPFSFFPNIWKSSSIKHMFCFRKHILTELPSASVFYSHSWPLRDVSKCLCYSVRLLISISNTTDI